MSKPNAAFAALVLSSCLACLTGCTALQSVSVTQIPSDRSRPLRAEVSNSAFLGIHFDNSFLEPLTADLMRQCPRGRVTGLLTKQESTLYIIVETRRVIATGYCVYDVPGPQQNEATAMREAR